MVVELPVAAFFISRAMLHNERLPFQPFLFSLGLLLFSIPSFALADDAPQKMRLPVGEYWIGGGGGGGGRDAPRNTATGGGAGGNGSGSTGIGSPGAFPAGLPGNGAGSLPIITLPARSDGGGYKLPAYCIDLGRHPPNPKTSISHVSGGAKVQQYRGQQLGPVLN
jgi:hypothetical protein